jgi:hypothetical protein
MKPSKPLAIRFFSGRTESGGLYNSFKIQDLKKFTRDELLFLA